MKENSLSKRKSNNINTLKIGGFTPLTSIDFPEELSAVIFLQGCPWRCRYCQNNSLLAKANQQNISYESIIQFLKSRQGLLDAVVFSGGEPTMQENLSEVVLQVKQLGFKVGLHTAGVFPERFKKLLPHLDWVGFDVKALVEDYAQITGSKSSGKRAWLSLNYLLESGISYEIRTTIHSEFLNQKKLDLLITRLSNKGVNNYVLQKCRTKNCYDKSLTSNNFDFLNKTLTQFYTKQFDQFSIRNL